MKTARYLTLVLALFAFDCGQSYRTMPEPPGTVPALSARGREALYLLDASDCFKMSHVGRTGETPPEAVAFRDLLREPAAIDAFHALTESNRLPARLYGLCGLYLTDRALYEAQARSVQLRGGEVCTEMGCIRDKYPVAGVIGHGESDRWEIANGHWPADLAGSAQDPAAQR